MLAILKHLVQNGYVLNSNEVRTKATFILRCEHGTYKLSEREYNKSYKLSLTKVLRGLYADT
jgi:hypothetical protein